MLSFDMSDVMSDATSDIVLTVAASETAGGSPADSALSGRQATSMHIVKRTEIVLLCVDIFFKFIFFSFL